MPPIAIALALLLAAYLIGAIPFGYLIGRMKGVNLFHAGSGNIGATNAGRVLGRKFGVLVFLLDFAKGALPVAGIVPLARLLEANAITALASTDALRVGAAALAFLGHLFPVYLGFRGGKGIATGAGTIAVLVPGPAGLAVLAWIVVLFASRLVSLASLVALFVLLATWLFGTVTPFGSESLPIAIYLFAAGGLVIVKHRSNVKRLIAGTENRIGEFNMRQSVLRGLHVLTLGMWFGGAAFFNFVVAPSIFRSFGEVVHAGPSDRTANETIIPGDASLEREKALASALAGSAVGPVFAPYFAMQAVCAAIAFITAFSWWKAEGGRSIHRWRVRVLGIALLSLCVAWPISQKVSELRLQRFDGNAEVAAKAKAAFGPWHLASLGLSFVTVSLAGVALVLAAKLPERSTTG